MNIDLSFTKDPTWIAARTEVWAPIEHGLKSKMRKSKLASVKQYFFTGEAVHGFDLGDPAKITYFPLTTPEGWNYVFQHLARDGASLYKSEYYQSINDSLAVLGDMDVRLRYFDYFHSEQHKSTVTTPVPVTPKGEVLTFEVDLFKKFKMLSANTSIFLTTNHYELMQYTRHFYFEMFSEVDAHILRDDGAPYRLVTKIMKQALDFQLSEELESPQLRRSYLADFRVAVEKLEDNNVIKQLWLEVQQKGEGA